MRRLMPYLTLIHKEWRDTRALSIASALLVPIAVLAINEGFLDWRGDIGASFVPIAVALYLLVIASDLIAADVSSGRAKSYAALPVRASTLWATKLAFLAVAGLGFTAWTLAATSTLYATFAPAQAFDSYLADLSRGSWMVPAVGIGVVATVVFWSSILERGMAVVGAALVTCATLGAVIPLIAMYDRELLPADGALLWTVAGLPIVFLAGSLFGFVRGPHHASTVLRRLAVTAIVPIAMLLPTGAVSAAVLLERLDVEPGDADVRVAAGHVSPNGRYLAILASKQHKHARTRTWILDLEDGSIAQLRQRGLQADWSSPWNADGSYVAWTTTKQKSWELRHEYDPETGAILRTRSHDQVYAAQGYPWVRWATTRRDGNELVVTMQETGVERRIPTKHFPSFARVPGYVLNRTAEGAYLHDLRNDTTTLLHAGEKLSTHFSPRGEYVQVWDNGKQAIYATRTGERMPLPDGLQVGWPGGNSSDHYALRFSQTEPTLLVDLRTGKTSELSPDPNRADRGWCEVRVLDDERILQLNRNGRVDIYDQSGKKLRTAWDPRKGN